MDPRIRYQNTSAHKIRKVGYKIRGLRRHNYLNNLNTFYRVTTFKKSLCGQPTLMQNYVYVARILVIVTGGEIE